MTGPQLLCMVSRMTISKKEWRQKRIEQKAKELAFADLDIHDQKMYLSEAEKTINKSDLKLYGKKEFDLINAAIADDKNKRCPTCDRMSIPRGCPNCND